MNLSLEENEFEKGQKIFFQQQSKKHFFQKNTKNEFMLYITHFCNSKNDFLCYIKQKSFE